MHHATAGRFPIPLLASSLLLLSSAAAAPPPEMPLPPGGLEILIRHDGVQATALPAAPGRARSSLRLALTAMSRGTATQSLPTAAPEVSATRTILRQGPVQQWFAIHQRGLEQGFTLPHRPLTDADGPVTLQMKVDGRLRAVVMEDRRNALFAGELPEQAIAYGGLKVYDAHGQDLEAWLEAKPGRLDIVFRDGGASYPVTVDPLMTAPYWIAEGNQEGSFFGWTAASAGDVNGDGFDDVIIGMPNYADEGPGEGNVPGKVMVYYGCPLGLQTTPAWTRVGENRIDESPEFGFSVAGAGDVNGDGYDDVIIGARNLTHEFREGAAQVYLGSPGGLASQPAWVARAPDQLAQFGHAVAGAGDVNGDGYDDVLVGAPSHRTQMSLEGGAYLYLGSPSGPSLTPDWTVDGNAPYASMGFSVDAAGDINGDGYGDIIVGAYGHPVDLVSSIRHGRLYVWHGGPDGIAGDYDWAYVGEQAFGFLGQSVAGAGDVNGDGYDDVIGGAYLLDEGEVDEGKVYVWHGGPGGLAAAPSWTHQPNAPGAQEGWRVGAAGDINGDGFDDVLVSAYKELITYLQEGQVKLFLGSSTGLAAAPSWSQNGNQSLSLFSDAIGRAGDVNGDGRMDLILGTALYDMDQVDEGTAFVYLNTCGGTTDRDGDGLARFDDPLCSTGELVDCNDRKANLMTSPGPVGFMELSNGVSGTDLVWTPPASPGAGSVNYDLVRSLSATDFGPAATCVESADPLDTVAVDADTPPSPGAVFYYLVRANNACPDGAGSLGWNSAGDARNARSCP